MNQFERQNLARLSETNEAARNLIDSEKQKQRQEFVENYIWCLCQDEEYNMPKVKAVIIEDAEVWEGLKLKGLINHYYLEAFNKQKGMRFHLGALWPERYTNDQIEGLMSNLARTVQENKDEARVKLIQDFAQVVRKIDVKI